MTVRNARNNQVLVNELEIANSIFTRIVGLMGRPTLVEGRGLLIKRSGNSIHTFFMRFSIDLVFVNSKGQIKYLVRNMKPWKLAIAPVFLRTDCLELPAGTIDKTNTKTGDYLSVET